MVIIPESWGNYKKISLLINKKLNGGGKVFENLNSHKNLFFLCGVYYLTKPPLGIEWKRGKSKALGGAPYANTTKNPQTTFS
jgi:hypothetical protein